MEILATYKHYQLIRYEDNFFGYGTIQELNSLWGAGVNQYGTAQEVARHCYNIAKLCKDNIVKYRNEHNKDNHAGWLVLISHEKEELNMLIKFAKVLKQL